MNQDVVSIASDRGIVVLFDPDLHRDRVKAPSSWWKEAPLALAERRDGRLAVWPVSAGKATGRSHRFRLTDALDPEREAPFVCGAAAPTPLRVIGGELFVGPIERLPSDGAGDRLPALPDKGRVLNWEPGTYAVTAHVLDWQREERFWNEDNEPTADAPPDVVFVLEPAGEDALPVAPAALAPLLELLPRKTPTASTKVRYATRPRPVEKPERAPRGRSRGATSTRPRAPKAPPAPALRPGELGVGATVRHPVYGIGTVVFLREGFPKAKVTFHDREYKVDKDDLKVV